MSLLHYVYVPPLTGGLYVPSFLQSSVYISPFLYSRVRVRVSARIRLKIRVRHGGLGLGLDTVDQGYRWG